MTVFTLLAIAVVTLLFLSLSRLGKSREITEEEFEREAKARPSMVRTGLQEFQSLLEPEKKAAIEAVQKEKRKTDQQISGEPP